ncbi:MAG: hypothetical protein WC755_00265 [Candidatus Woesearchaeota archaeon]|jgi:hypothetical protein
MAINIFNIVKKKKVLRKHKFQIQNKKGAMKTLEAVIASLIIVVFTAFLIPSGANNIGKDSVGVLNKLGQNENFRHCVVLYNVTCVDNYIKTFLPQEYQSSYTFIVTKNINSIPTGIPSSDVINENTYIATDGKINEEYIVRLFYWNKEN